MTARRHAVVVMLVQHGWTTTTQLQLRLIEALNEDAARGRSVAAGLKEFKGYSVDAVLAMEVPA